MIVQGTVFFAHLAAPDTSGAEYASGKYDVTVGRLSKDHAKILKDAGIRVSTCTKDDETKNRGLFFKPKSTQKPRVVDFSKKPMTDEEIKTIGNGSTVNVIINAWGKGKNKGAILEAVQVVNLVPYSGREDFEELKGEEDPF